MSRAFALPVVFGSLLGLLTGCSAGTSNATQQTQQTQSNPQPSVASLSPASVVAGSAAQTITVTGSGFVSDAVVALNGTPLATSYTNSSTLQVTLSATQFAAGQSLTLTVTNPAPGGGTSSVALAVISPLGTFSVTPSLAQVGSGDTTMSVQGSGFFPDSVAQWSGTALATKYVSAISLSVVVPAALLATAGVATINVKTPENPAQATQTQNFTAYLTITTNDLAWNPVDGLLYATVAGDPGQTYGNSLVGVDPNTGQVVKSIFVGSEPTGLTLSTDGTQAFVELNGAAAVRQVDLKNNVAGVQWGLGQGTLPDDPPTTAAAVAAVPGQPNAVVVYSTLGVVTIYDSGVARPKSGVIGAFGIQNSGAMVFGSSPSTLYLMAGPVYQVTVDATGITGWTRVSNLAPDNNVQYDAGRLYFADGEVMDAATGGTVGQFQVAGTPAITPISATGPRVSESAQNRDWVLVTPAAGASPILTAFDQTTFAQVGSAAIPTVSPTSALQRLVRWGQNGLAFNAGKQLYILKSTLVKDNSSTPVDLQATAHVPATATTGTPFATQIQLSNSGPNACAGTALSVVLPASWIQGTVSATQGSCGGTGTVLCELGTVASGASATVTVNATASSSGTFQLNAVATTQSFDSNPGNNQATASMTVSGAQYSPAPNVSSIAPNAVAAGSPSYTMSVTGSGFTSASTVKWNGTSLPTTFVSATSLTAMVDLSLVKSLGWAAVTVSNAAPGGGTSQPMAESIYSLLPIPANAMVYDPYKRVLWAVLPSTSASPAGNSLITIDPLTGTVGSPVPIGGEPNVIAETTSGNYLWIGLSATQSLGRFNIATGVLDAKVSLTTATASSIAVVPGTDTIVSVPNVAIYDFNGTTATARPNSSFGYGFPSAQFTDASHAFTFDSSLSSHKFYRYTADATGLHVIDATTLDGLGQGTDKVGFVIDQGIGFGMAGGVFNPFGAVPSMLGQINFGYGSYSSIANSRFVPYAAAKKAFVVGGDEGVRRCDSASFQCEDELQLFGNNAYDPVGTRWGQDGLAYVLAPAGAAPVVTQVLLLRGPFVLPTELYPNTAPTLTAVGTGTVAVGSGNQRIAVAGSGFMPGASVMWNGVAHDTVYTDAQTLSVAVGASEVSNAATVPVTVRNPGSGDSSAISVMVK